jgi:hypothetical protein
MVMKIVPGAVIMRKTDTYTEVKGGRLRRVAKEKRANQHPSLGGHRVEA